MCEFRHLASRSLFGGRVPNELGLWEVGACTVLPQVATRREANGKARQGE